MFSVRGFTPVVGQRVDVLYKVPNVYEFTGTILRVTGDSQNQHQDALWTIEAADDRWLLDRYALVSGYFASRGINGVTADLLASYTDGGFSVGEIPAFVLGDTGITVSDGRLLETLQTLRGAVSARHLYVSPERHVSINSTNHRGFNMSGWLTVQGSYTVFDVSYSRDITQSRTRVTVLGRATTVVAFAATGATTVYIADATPFLATGGTARVGHQELTYTSIGATTLNGSAVRTLTGVSGVVADISAQSEIRPVTTSDDAGAQTDLAALLGGLSGVAVGVEHHDEAGQEATAQLASRALQLSADAVPIETLRFTTRYPLGVVHGRTVITASAPFGVISTILEHVEIMLTRTRDSFGDDFNRHVVCATRIDDMNAQLSGVLQQAGRAA
jgi:hypothetical protein